ncbi:hypothetical protein [Bacillus sp. Hm123]|uniref:hypothetical protein n=1 Tax=Bacillus sp. Hm123 TaxID=3450745 RepID=UPI003F437E38
MTKDEKFAAKNVLDEVLLEITKMTSQAIKECDVNKDDYAVKSERYGTLMDVYSVIMDKYSEVNRQ